MDLRLSPRQISQLGEVCERYGVQTLEVFGSFARGDAAADSDVDLLYTLRPGVRLGWAIEGLADELSSILGHPVDLVGRTGIHPRIRTQVLAEAEVLYAA